MSLKINFLSLYILLAGILLAFGVNQSSFANEAKQILIVVSGHGKAQGEEQPGFEFDEFAKAYLTFAANGVEVDVASPLGGAVEADRYDPNKLYNQHIHDDKTAMAKIENTLPLNSIKAADYDGVFIIGGKGAMFDLPKDKHLSQLLTNVYQANGSIGAVCHGPAALVDVKLSDGSYLIAGKKVNGFTNTEEAIFGKKWSKHFDFMLEDKLIERGGHFQSSPMMLSHVAVDGRLVTGQNPTSTVETAQALLKTMGITPIKQKPHTDDATLHLVARVLEGDTEAAKQILVDPDSYEAPMMGMYGFYFLASAETPEAIEQSLLLMNTAQKTMQHPKLGLGIAQAQQKLGRQSEAKKTLLSLLAKHPELDEAKTMLEQL